MGYLKETHQKAGLSSIKIGRKNTRKKEIRSSSKKRQKTIFRLKKIRSKFFHPLKT
jgi:hypothetical protein